MILRRLYLCLRSGVTLVLPWDSWLLTAPLPSNPLAPPGSTFPLALLLSLVAPSPPQSSGSPSPPCSHEPSVLPCPSDNNLARCLLCSLWVSTTWNSHPWFHLPGLDHGSSLQRLLCGISCWLWPAWLLALPRLHQTSTTPLTVLRVSNCLYPSPVPRPPPEPSPSSDRLFTARGHAFQEGELL